MPRKRARERGPAYPILNIWPPLPLGVYMRRPSRRLAFPLTDPRCTLHAFGRHALWTGVGVLGLEPGDEVLVPAYHHGSEVEALVRRGASCLFYEATPTLEPDPDELETLVSRRTRALLLIHYLGFPQDARRWRRWCEDRGLLLIEDVAQGWPGTVAGRPLGSDGHISIFCLYKTFGLPDGAALLVDGSNSGTASRAQLGIALLARRHLAWIRSRSTTVARAIPWTPDPVDLPDEELALGDPSAGVSRTTTFVLPRVFDPDVAERRRTNYSFLLHRLAGWVPTPFDALPDGASPFLFPVRTEQKAYLLARLAEANIRAVGLWSFAHPLMPEDRFPGAALRRTIVGVPVHQELRAEDLERISALVAEHA